MKKILQGKVLAGAFIMTLAVFCFVFSAHNAKAATCTMTTGTWDGVAGVAGTGTATFSSCAGGTTTRPAIGDTIQINTGVTLTITGNATVGGIIIDSPVAADGLTINTGVTLTDSGNLSYTANATANPQTITIAGTGVLAVAGTGTVNAPTGAGNSLVTCSGSGSLTFGSTLALTGNSTSTGKASFGMGACTLSAAGITLTGGSNATGVAEITASTGTITSTAGGITFAGTPANTDITTSGAGVIVDTGTISGAGVLSLTAGTLLQTHGTSAINTAYTTWKNIEVVDGITTLGAVQTVTGLQVDNGATLAQSTFLLTNTCTSTGVAGFTISGTTTGAGGTALTGAGCTIDGIGTVAGTSTWTGAKTVASTASITFSGTIALSAATTVTNNGSVTTTAAGGITGADAVTSIWTQGTGSSIYFSGATTSLLSTGVLNASATNNLINYNLGGAQTVKVPSSGTYYNLSLSGSGTKTLGAVTLTVNGTFSVTGAVASLDPAIVMTTNLLTLAGSPQVIGTWGFTGSGATNINTTYFLNTGKLAVAQGFSGNGSGGQLPSGGSTNSTVAQSPTSVTVVITPATPTNPAVVENTMSPGCSGGNTFNVATGKVCVNNAGSQSSAMSTIHSASYDFGTAPLKNGSKGNAVKQLQMFLNANLGMSLTLDGKLGPKTIAIIKAWQKAHDLAADGVIGAKTKAMMNSMAQ